MSVAIMGCDPGVNGGFAVLNAHGCPIYVRGLNSKMTEDQALDVVFQAARWLMELGGWECYFEKVGHITGDGGQGSHTFGYIKGLLRGALRAYGIHLIDVPPQLWQTRMECLTGGDKNVSKRRAIELFSINSGGFKITHAVADALLIAEYGRRHRHLQQQQRQKL